MPLQVPLEQTSFVVQLLLSLQEVPFVALQDWLKTAPPQVASPPQEAPLQVRVWVPLQVPAGTLQELQALKVAGTGLLVLAQTPLPLQASVVQELPSLLQAVPDALLVKLQAPVAVLQVPPVWHSLGVQVTGLEPTQEPLLHESVWVQALLSLQEVPLVLREQVALPARLQEPEPLQ